MRIGIIGVGVIAVAVIKALEGKYGNSAHFFLSPRNALKATMLRDDYPNVSVMQSNQEVVDDSDIIKRLNPRRV